MWLKKNDNSVKCVNIRLMPKVEINNSINMLALIKEET
jgi:hypothetical protein